MGTPALSRFGGPRASVVAHGDWAWPMGSSLRRSEVVLFVIAEELGWETVARDGNAEIFIVDVVASREIREVNKQSPNHKK